MVSKYWPPQLGLEQSERKHASVIWRLFLTFRHMYAHPHLNLSSIPNFHPFFTLQLFLYRCHHIFPGFLPLCHLFCGLQAMWVVLYWLTPVSFILLSDVQELLQLFYRDHSLAVEVISCPCRTRNQTSATAKINSYLSKPVKTKTSLSKIHYEWH